MGGRIGMAESPTDFCFACPLARSIADDEWRIDRQSGIGQRADGYGIQNLLIRVESLDYPNELDLVARSLQHC